MSTSQITHSVILLYNSAAIIILYIIVANIIVAIYIYIYVIILLYNSHFSDVLPFLEAVENMCTYYETRGVDIFKEAVSGNLVPCSILDVTVS